MSTAVSSRGATECPGVLTEGRRGHTGAMREREGCKNLGKEQPGEMLAAFRVTRFYSIRVEAF